MGGLAVLAGTYRMHRSRVSSEAVSWLHREIELKVDPCAYHRRSIRLRGYDYSQAGAYFVTTVTKRREKLFGDTINDKILMNRYGEIVQNALMDLPRHYPNVSLGKFIIMPNHIHVILIIHANDSGRGGSFQTENLLQITSNEDWHVKMDNGQTRPYAMMHHGLPEIVRAFKSFSARRINQIRHSKGEAVWQRNYYEHIIRDQRELDPIRRYIINNPRRWSEDKEYHV